MSRRQKRKAAPTTFAHFGSEDRDSSPVPPTNRRARRAPSTEEHIDAPSPAMATQGPPLNDDRVLQPSSRRRRQRRSTPTATVTRPEDVTPQSDTVSGSSVVSANVSSENVTLPSADEIANIVLARLRESSGTSTDMLQRTSDLATPRLTALESGYAPTMNSQVPVTNATRTVFNVNQQTLNDYRSSDVTSTPVIGSAGGSRSIYSNFRTVTSRYRNMTTAENMKPVEGSIWKKLKEKFEPQHLEVLNESNMHNVPKGSETHFKVVVISEKFADQPLINRLRMVNETLQEELDCGVHALSILAKTPKQWEDSGRVIQKSPPCRGGSGL